MCLPDTTIHPTTTRRVDIDTTTTISHRPSAHNTTPLPTPRLSTRVRKPQLRHLSSHT